jgi:hypothetical protein
MSTLEITPSIADTLPSSVKQALSKLPTEIQSTFEDEYKRKYKNKTVMLLLAIFFPIQHFLLGKVGMGILFFITLGGLWVWWVIEIFLAIPRTRTFNEDLAKTILRDLKIMNS